MPTQPQSPFWLYCYCLYYHNGVTSVVGFKWAWGLRSDDMYSLKDWKVCDPKIPRYLDFNCRHWGVGGMIDISEWGCLWQSTVSDKVQFGVIFLDEREEILGHIVGYCISLTPKYCDSIDIKLKGYEEYINWVKSKQKPSWWNSPPPQIYLGFYHCPDPHWNSYEGNKSKR